MSRQTLVAYASALALTFVTGVAFGQGLLGAIDPELRTAHQLLNEAAMHLERARNADDRSVMRARAYVALAISEIDPGYHSFRDDLTEPPRDRATPPRPAR